jgi:outer membrane protein assembly factor BamB
MVTEERFLEIEGIKNKFANLEEKIRQASEAKTELIVDLASNNQAAKPDNINLYKNNLYLADSESKTIYKIDLATKKTDSYGQGLEKTARLDLVAQSEKLLYFWSGQDIFIYNLDKLDGEHYTVNGLASTSEISGLGVFGGKVYIFDGNSSQLYRLSYANGRFANPVSWFKNKPSADNLKNFYLDGNAYLLFDDRLEKYAKGNKQNFALANPEPPIKRLTAMISGEQHLYLADPENKRLLIFKNNGQLERQLENELLGEVSALALNEQAKKIYALSGQKIYSISLEAK